MKQKTQEVAPDRMALGAPFVETLELTPAWIKTPEAARIRMTRRTLEVTPAWKKETQRAMLETPDQTPEVAPFEMARQTPAKMKTM